MDPLQLTKQYSAQVRRDRELLSANALSIELEAHQVPGTRLILQAEIEQGQLKALGYKIRSCAIGHAALGILLQYAQGLTLEKLNLAQQQLEAILAGELSETSQLIFPELALFASAITLTERHPVAVLPFSALRQLFQLAAEGEK